jgi:hypothetical protein
LLIFNGTGETENNKKVPPKKKVGKKNSTYLMPGDVQIFQHPIIHKTEHNVHQPNFESGLSFALHVEGLYRDGVHEVRHGHGGILPLLGSAAPDFVHVEVGEGEVAVLKRICEEEGQRGRS